MKKNYFIIFFIFIFLQSISYSDEKILDAKDLQNYLYSIEISEETTVEDLYGFVTKSKKYNEMFFDIKFARKYKSEICGGEWSDERKPCYDELGEKHLKISQKGMRAGILFSKAKMNPEYKKAIDKLRNKKASNEKKEAAKVEDEQSKENKVVEEIKNIIISLGGTPINKAPGWSDDFYVKKLFSQKKAVEQKNIEDKINKEKEKAAKKSKETLAERCKKEKEKGTISMECAEYKDPSQMKTAFKLKCNLEGKTFYTKSNVSITHLIEFKLYKSDGKTKLIAFLDNTEVRPWNLQSRIGDADYSVERKENDPQTIFPGGFTFISFEVPIDMRPLHLDGGADPVSIFFDVSLEKAIKQKVGNFYMRSYMTKINREIPDSSAKGTRPHPDYIQDNNCKIY